MANGNDTSTSDRRYFRRQLRQATFILPQTGQRVKRNVTLRDVQHSEDGSETESSNEQSPLLQRQQQQQEQGTALYWLRTWTRDGFKSAYAFCNSMNGHKVIKCSLAYLLATMGTFSAPIASLLGTHFDANQIVANIVTWFDQNRSVGSMLQGVLLAFVAFLYSAFVAFGSQAVSVFFADRGAPAAGHAIVLLVFCWGGLGFIAWTKQHAGHPLVNVACSLASLGVVTCLTKEGVVQRGDFSYYKIIQVLKMLVMGIVINFFVNLCIWPISARTRLREGLMKTTDTFGELLAMTTASFLSGSEEDLNHPSVTAASDRLKATFNTLPKHLAEAKMEHYVLGTERQYSIERRLLNCVQQLRTDMGGLRSAASVQISLLSNEDEPTLLQSKTKWHSHGPPDVYYGAAANGTGAHRNPSLQADANESWRSPADGLFSPKTPKTPLDPTGEELHRIPSIQTTNHVFESFIVHLGPPMRSMAYTLKEILKSLPAEYGRLNNLPRFRSSLAEAINLFRTSRKQALDFVYRSKALSKTYSFHIAADFEEVAASCGHFGSSLEDLAEHCLRYLDILDELELEVNERPNGRTWNWLFFWKKRDLDVHVSTTDSSSHDEEAEPDFRTNSSLSIPSLQSEEEKHAIAAGFPYRLYPYFRVFRREDVRFAFKVGGGATFYAMFAFIPQTEEIFHRWHLEWSLVSYMLVCSMNLGASNTTAWGRSFGTFLGAVGAVFVWIICDENPYRLAFCGWLVSLACFYIIVVNGNGPKGRFILLTYNLSVLYTYGLITDDPDTDDDEQWHGVDEKIFGVASDRFTAVILGVLGGLIVTYFIWPISARDKVKTGLSLLWLRMGLVWKRGPLSILLLDDPESRPAYMDIRTETDLRAYMDKIDSLRTSAENEFRLSHPFPIRSFDICVKSTKKMLDAFHALNVLITKDLKASPGERAILEYTAAEREALCTRISHLLSVLASSLSLGYPLNDAFPRVNNTRDRLLAKIFEFRQNQGAEEGATEEDFELLYCFALVTRQLAKEIEVCGRELENLYGVLSEKILKLQ